MNKKKAIVVSGYFNPLHKGHLELFENAKQHGDELWVIVNSDEQRELKGSKEFMDEVERWDIIKALRIVDDSLISIDSDATQCMTLQMLAVAHEKQYTLAFANGGDQDNSTIPEKAVCDEYGIELIDGLGDKIQSSSWLLNKK